MNKQQIKDLALSNGFKLKQQPSGEMDLNPYVYDFVEALLAKANERVAEVEKRYTIMLHEVANQYDGNDSTEWSIGANHVFKLFAKWIHKSQELRKE